MTIIKRKSCRALILTPELELLLIKIANPSSRWVGWITPGGGLEPGESELEGLARELKEELGLEDFAQPAKVWTRSQKFEWGGRSYDQDEVFYFFRCEKFPLNPGDLTEAERADFKELRWWRLTDIENSAETFAPLTIAKGVRALLEKIPQKPIHVGS